MGIGQKGQLIVISGPPAGGKDSVCRELAERGFSVIRTTTSRLPRVDDLPGDYEFVSVAEFEDLVKQGVFGDLSPVHKGSRYGTRKSELRKSLNQKMVWRIDPTSCANAREIVGKAFTAESEICAQIVVGIKSFWVMPENMKELERRIKLRDIDQGLLESDLRQLKIDMDFFESNREKFDFVVINRRDQLKEVVEEIEGMISK